MEARPANLDPAFLNQQRDSLRALRSQLLKVIRRDDVEQEAVNAAQNDHPGDYEDDAQRLAANELAGNVSAASEARLATIERALQKIEMGSYGYSEESGKPIPVERLRAYPDAILTLEEQESRERLRPPAG